VGLAAFRRAVFDRDLDTCQFCGLRSKKYHDLLARNGFDWSMRAVFTACIFCSQCLTLESVISQRSGVLIRLPEMSQAALHQVMRVVYILRLKRGLSADTARRVFDLFIERRRAAGEHLTSDDPAFLAGRMEACSMTEELCELRRKLRDIRLFPLDRRIISESDLEFNQFPQILAYWRSKDGPYASLAREDGEQRAVALLNAVLEGLN
jgi:intracellular multiplication protein IcmJ